MSTIDLKLKNEAEFTGFSEYATHFDLPEGCWIRDYYLYVGDRKEKGILAEKKAAKWIYSQIRNVRRDPGILYYLTGNRVAFRVFPFSAQETRKTGFELVHKEPIIFRFDDKEVLLGREDVGSGLEDASGLYVSTRMKSRLDTVYRKPYYHFILDASLRNTEAPDRESVITRVNWMLEDYPLEGERGKVTFAGAFNHTVSMDDDWKEKYRKHAFEGGFYAERAIEKILFEQQVHMPDRFPVIVLVKGKGSLIDRGNYADMRTAFPEGPAYYILDKDSELLPRSLLGDLPDSSSLEEGKPIAFLQPVLAYPNVESVESYLPATGEGSVLVRRDYSPLDTKSLEPKTWESGWALESQRRMHAFFPGLGNKQWLNAVRGSFHAQVMSPVTSFLVVENEAQKAMLYKKQKQALAGNPNLDLDAEAERMSEPELGLIVLLLLVLYAFRKYRTAKGSGISHFSLVIYSFIFFDKDSL